MPRERRQAFHNMKDGQCHQEAVERSIAIRAMMTKDVGEHISSAHEEDKDNNIKAPIKILSNIRFLARQGIRDVATDKEIILTSHRFSNCRQLCSFHVVGQENEQASQMHTIC